MSVSPIFHIKKLGSKDSEMVDYLITHDKSFDLILFIKHLNNISL